MIFRAQTLAMQLKSLLKRWMSNKGDYALIDCAGIIFGIIVITSILMYFPKKALLA